MQLTAKVKLVVTPEQAKSLRATIQQANACCDWLSERAWQEQVFSQFPLHKIAYYAARETFPILNSCVVVRCESKVAQAYKLDKKVQRTFQPLGAIEYDHNILTWQVNKKQVSIWSVDGRLRLSFLAGEHQLALMQGKIGQADLCLVNGEFYLTAPCFVEQPIPTDVADFLGVDMGIVNIATDSDGTHHSGAEVEKVRRTFSHRRRNLQRKGTKAATRKLRQIKRKQSRFQHNTNHVISKQIVQKAHDTQRGIAIEALGGIRDRIETKVNRRQRTRISNWAFSDLRLKIEYKAAWAGVIVVPVDPRNTSRTCNECGCIDKANRRSQSSFKCVSCGHVASADHNAALNIGSRARAKVNGPNVNQ